MRAGSAATTDVTASAAAADAKALLDIAGGVLGGGEARRVRFEVASKNLDDEVQGAYGEFPLTGLLAVLEHPAVNEVLVAAEHGWGSAEGSVDDAAQISRAAAFHKEGDCPGEDCPFEETPNAFQPSLVDIGSGAGRLILAASTMRAWRSVVGIEASEPLANLGALAVEKLEKENVLRGLVRSVHADACPGSGSVECLFDASCPEPRGRRRRRRDRRRGVRAGGCGRRARVQHGVPLAGRLASAELSAALAAVIAGRDVVGDGQWLIGPRFEFADMLTVQGEEGPEDKIRCFIWRVKGHAGGGAGPRFGGQRRGGAGGGLAETNKRGVDGRGGRVLAEPRGLRAAPGEPRERALGRRGRRGHGRGRKHDRGDEVTRRGHTSDRDVNFKISTHDPRERRPPGFGCAEPSP